MEEDRRRLFRSFFWFPRSLTVRTVGVYASGALWASGYCAFLDCVLYSVFNNGSNVHVSFMDWIPIICTTFGMLLVTAIDKNMILESSLRGTSFMNASQRTWQAQSLLFCGLALLGFGLSGSFALLLLKYIEPRNVTSAVTVMGWHNLLANFLVMASCALLWVAQSVEDEYNYSLTL